MASKIIDPRPVALPNLSQLPDPMKDLMGGSALLNPTSMMTMSQRDINDLFNPKPIDGNLIKPSAEAAKVLQTAQQEAASQLELAARQQQQHDEMLARRRKEEEQRIEVYRKRAEEIAKEREKALKEKKEQQGGKLGAAPDGSFLADRFVKNVTSDKGWNDIVSTLERNDVMEAELAKFETALRNSNVADDIIQEELKRARTGISSHTKQYEKEFTKEGLELTDLGVSLGKNATNLASYATLLGTSTGTGKAISGIVKSVSGRDIQTDTINMLVDARTAIDSKYSGTLKLRRANDQYTMEKAKRAAGGELGWADEASTAIKSMWDNDMGVYYAIEAVPDLIGSAGAGFVGKLLLKGGAKVVGRVISKELAETTAMKNLAKIVSGTMTTKSKTANLALKGLSVPSLSASGYGVASTMAATATDTYDTIRHTSSEVLSKHYGAENWNALVSEVGEQKAKEILATQAARDAASNIGPVALLTSMYGLEGAVGGLMIKRAAAEVVGRTAVSKTRTAANLVGSVTLGAGTEALEEGYTQYSSNVAMNPLTGVNPMEDVARAAASGAYVGGVLNGTIKAADMAGTYRAINSLNNISADKGFTTNADGTVTFDSNAFKSAMGEAFATVNKVHREGHGSFSDGKAATQAYYDRIFDADERYQQYATPEQKTDVQKFARENYGVNTNNFTFFDDNETSSAFKSDDIERVRATGNELLLDSYRIKHGVELDQVNPENTQVAKAIARSIDHVNTLDPNLNTFQREHEFQKFIENDLDKDASLDVEDRAAIVQFMGTHYGTRATRMTDEEQAAYDEQVKQYQASQQENADEPVSQATATDGAGSPRQTGGQPTQEQDTEVGADGQQVPPQSDTQSPRNASTRQTDNASTTEDFSAEPSQTNGGPNAGAAEVQNARDTGNPTSSKTGGGTPTQNGNTGQANQGGQSFGQTGPSTPQTPNGGRSTGATTAERRADNGSDQTSTEAVANALRDGIRPVTTQELRHANKAIQNILNKAKGLKGKHTYDPKRLELWVTASADGFAELNYGISNKHKTNLDDKRDNNTNLRNTAIVAILAFREKGGKTLQSKTNAEQTTADTNTDNGSQDVGETDVADIVDENPQAAVEQGISELADETKLSEEVTDVATVTETTNANEQNQTQTEPRESSPTIDTTTTQDRAGASGLSDDTQTAASQAEPVKPKRGGRSKKKTTTQLDLFEQEQTNADEQAEGISQERRTGLSSEYRQTTERTTTPLDIEQESQAYKNELKADFLHRVQNGEILAIQRHIDEFTKQLIAKKDDDIRATNTTKKRAKDFAEVTTPVSVIDDMLETARRGGSNFNIDLNAKILDPATGDGRYLLRALVRRSPRIFMESDLVAGNILRALASLTGIELQTENAQRARNNLYSVGLEYFKLANIDPTPYINALQQITTNAIIEGDTLNPNSDMLVHTYTVIDDIGVQHYTAPYADVVQGKDNLTQQDTIIFDSITQQEQTNAKENDLGQSVQPTQERTQDDNEVVRERTSNEPTNDAQGEILGQGGQPVSEQSQESGAETTQDTDQLGVEPVQFADLTQFKIKRDYGDGTIDYTIDPNTTLTTENGIPTILSHRTDNTLTTVELNLGNGNKVSTFTIEQFAVREDKVTPLDSEKFSLKKREKAKDWLRDEADFDAEPNANTVYDFIDSIQDKYTKQSAGKQVIKDELAKQSKNRKILEEYFNAELQDQYDTVEDFIEDFGEKMAFEEANDWKSSQAKPKTIPKGGRIGSQSGAVELDFLLALPIAVYRAAKAVWNAIKKNVAAVSMTLAITTGTTFAIPTEANAATPTETAVVQNIVSQNDNQGKQFIVADKQAGTLTLYTPQGQEVTSTPALFGKATGDSISTNNATPSGRYDLKHVDGNNIKGNEKGQYGNSAQALVVSGRLQENNAGNVAIHRVLPIESRQAKLDSATATDNRVSHGCINVPSSFYDIHLDRQQDTVVYVMPETNAGRTGVFATQVEQTPQSETTTPAVDKPTTDKDGYANAKTNTVEMTADEVTKAVNDSSQKVAKATTSQVLTVANTKPTGQIALVHSVVLPKVDVAATRMAVIQGQYTPAEQKANDKFDTEPVKEKYDGVGLSDIAVAIELALVGLAGGVVLTAGRRRRGRSDTDAQTTTEPPVDDTPDETQVETPTNDLPNDVDDNVITDPQDVELDDTMDSQYSEFVAYNNDVLLSEEEQQELYQALGFETIASEFDKSVAELQAIAESSLNGAEPGSNKLKSKKTATASGVKQAMKPPRTPPQIAIDRALMIRAMNNDPNIPKTWVTMASTAADILDEQLTNAHFNRVQGSETRQWKFVSTKKGNVGALAKLFNVLGGATPLLDTVARNNNIAAVGYEADSNVLSTSLAGIKMRRTGVFSVLSSRYLDPLNKNIHKLAYRAKVEQATLREDLGELANARHILDEAYAYHVKDIKEQIDIAQTAVDTIRSKIASQGGATAEQANDLSIVNKHLDELNTEFKLIDDTYNGKIAWDKSKVKLPGGRVKAEWEKIISDTKAKYGENYDSLVALSDDIYNALTETRKYAAAHGVYNTDQLASINNIGFKKYVPLYKKEKTADEVLSSHPDDEVQLSIVAKTLNKYSSNYRGFAVSQTRDLTRYHRQGATSPADNAYNNLEAYLLNMAGRIAEQPFREVLQQAYEGTTYTPYSASAITDPETLAELNTPEGSKFSGLIRVPVGGLEYLPNSLKERIKAPNGVEYVKPIRAKGYDKDGNVVDFDYYFTDKAVRDELYSNVDFSLEFDNLAVNALSHLTRFQAGLFTRFNPTWNAWNYVQDSSERISNILFREVRDKDGNRINRIKVAGAYVESLATMTANPHALFEILQYMHDDTKLETPLQRLLHEAKRSGAISLITSLTKRSTALQELKKSDVARLTEYAKNKFGVIIDSNIITHKGAKIVSASAELYFNTIVELPQILTALAAYEAYRSVGVNQAETANRVRDQFDPFRTQNSFIKKASVMYPFVRAAGAGGYNLLRTLTQYWGKGDRLGTVLTLAAGAAIMYGLQAMALAALGYDDDDEPYAKRLSATDLARGIPLKGSKGDVLFFPVGFGLNALVATITANVHSMQMGQQSGTEAMMNVAGSITHNLSPVNTGSSASWAKDPTAASILMLSPTIVQPLVEIATNTDAFTSRDIYGSKTPKDERDSEQGGANVPEKYKDYAKSIYKVGLDVRPETIQHLAENYLVGPLKAITADINDRADKTLGAESTKGEYYGTFATAIGLDLKRSHTALSDTNYSYKMLDLQSKILKSYNVPTSHAAEDYGEFDINRKTEGAAALTASKLRAAGASESEINFVLNAMEFSNARENINRDYNKAKVKLVRSQAEGAGTSEYINAYEQVQNYSSAVFDLTKTYISENRELYDEMLQKYK